MSNPRPEDGEEFLTLEQMEPEERIRFEHAGEWIAWDLDMTRAVAFGKDDEDVRVEAKKAGVERYVLEWVPPHPIYLDDAT